MSMAICNDCSAFMDTDEGDCYPFAYDHDAPAAMQDLCLCENCRDERNDRLMDQSLEELPA